MPHYLIQTEEITMSWIGAIKPEPDGWTTLCTFQGVPVLKVKSNHVTECTAEDVAHRTAKDVDPQRN